MNCFCFGDYCCAYYLFHIKIAVCCLRRTYADCLIRKLCMKRITVCLRIYCNGLNSHLAACTDYTYSYLSSVGYKNLIKHYQFSINLLQM